MVQQAHPRTSARRKRVAMLLALSIGALAVAALPPAPSSGVPGRASAVEPAAVGRGTPRAQALRTPRRRPPSRRRVRHRQHPDTPAIRSDLGRADVAVRDPAPTVAARHVGGLEGGVPGRLLHDRVERRRDWPPRVAGDRGSDAWVADGQPGGGRDRLHEPWVDEPDGRRTRRSDDSAEARHRGRRRGPQRLTMVGRNDRPCGRRRARPPPSRPPGCRVRRRRADLVECHATGAVPRPPGSPATDGAVDACDLRRPSCGSMVRRDPPATHRPDGLHPTDAGHRYIAERFLEAMAAR